MSHLTLPTPAAGAGMTPAASNTCYDTYSNCASLCGSSYASLCKKACGLC